jgi:hypothetical protein
MAFPLLVLLFSAGYIIEGRVTRGATALTHDAAVAIC